MKSHTRNGDDRRNETREGRERRNDAARKASDRIARNIETIAWLLNIPAWEFAWVADARRSLARTIETENAALGMIVAL